MMIDNQTALPRSQPYPQCFTCDVTYNECDTCAQTISIPHMSTLRPAEVKWHVQAPVAPYGAAEWRSPQAFYRDLSVGATMTGTGGMEMG